MNRKLVKQGIATLMVSLPIKWVKKFNLKKGDEVGIEEQENAVIITSSRSASIEADKMQKLISLYRNGFDEIEITFKDIKAIDKAREIMQELPGLDIVQQKKDSCLIRFSGKEDENIMNKLLSSVIDVSEGILGELKGKETDLNHIIYADAGVNKKANLAMRLNRNNSKAFYRAAALEELGDIYKELAGFVTKNKVKLNEKELKTFEKLNSMLKNNRIEKIEISSDVNCSLSRIYHSLKQMAEYQ